MTKPLSSAFDLAENTAVFICTRVFEGAPVLHVTHDEDGSWQFLCGGTDHQGEDQPKMVCIADVLKRDPTLVELAGLCIDHSADRVAKGAEWRIQDV
jgi:hypothetical protein